MPDNDLTPLLHEAVIDAIENKYPLQLVGGNSKSFYAREPQGQILNLAGHQGVIDYQPSELVITARSGTPLKDIEQVLASQGQMLAFEPPYFADSATLGGTIACGFSGPRRPYTGSARDFVLGCKMINGKGEVLSFGGTVMKNVAGYDVSRLMTGALGTLGVLLEISLKVLPAPDCESTRCLEMNVSDALTKMVKLAGMCLPVSGLCYDGSVLHVRLSGLEQTVHAAEQKIGGQPLAEASPFWQNLREQRLDFFQQSSDLWRLSVPPAIAPLQLRGAWLYDWGGAQRWLKTDQQADVIFAQAHSVKGHAQLFQGNDRPLDVFQPLPEKLQQLNAKLKQSFDPSGIFNPFRINRDW